MYISNGRSNQCECLFTIYYQIYIYLRIEYKQLYFHLQIHNYTCNIKIFKRKTSFLIIVTVPYYSTNHNNIVQRFITTNRCNWFENNVSIFPVSISKLENILIILGAHIKYLSNTWNIHITRTWCNNTVI